MLILLFVGAFCYTFSRLCNKMFGIIILLTACLWLISCRSFKIKGTQAKACQFTYPIKAAVGHIRGQNKTTAAVLAVNADLVASTAGGGHRVVHGRQVHVDALKGGRGRERERHAHVNE